jgi:hypothetical protein
MSTDPHSAYAIDKLRARARATSAKDRDAFVGNAIAFVSAIVVSGLLLLSGSSFAENVIGTCATIAACELMTISRILRSKS